MPGYLSSASRRPYRPKPTHPGDLPGPRPPDRGRLRRAGGNLFCAQPLLNVIAAGFGVSDGTAGLRVTCGQLGCAAGLALQVPFGDLLERRRLMTRVLVGAAAAMAWARTRRR